MDCWCVIICFFFFKQKTAYEMRISDWSSDVCSSDLRAVSCEIIVIHLHDDAPGCRTEQYGRQPAQSRQFESLHVYFYSSWTIANNLDQRRESIHRHRRQGFVFHTTRIAGDRIPDGMSHDYAVEVHDSDTGGQLTP